MRRTRQRCAGPSWESALRWQRLVAIVLLTGACNGQGSASRSVAIVDAAPGSLHGTDVSDVIHRPELGGTTTGGQRFSLRQAPDITALFFGYTRCPDVCPTTMADLASAVRRLDLAVRRRTHVVFVTQDPTHDTLPVLRRWLDRFDTAFEGVRPTSVQVNAQALTALKAPATDLVPVGSARGVEHTGSVYVFVGDQVVVYTGGTTPTQYAQDLTALAG